MTARLTFRPSGETLEVPEGISILDAAVLCDLDLAAPCAGQGRCGRCRVRIVDGVVRRRSNAGLDAEDVAAGWAVACQTFVTGPALIEVPEPQEDRARPRGHAVAEPESLPLDSGQRLDPAVSTFCIKLDPPSLGDTTSDLDRLSREVARQVPASGLRAELSIVRDLGRVLRASDWHVRVTVETRDREAGTSLPPRLVDVWPFSEPAEDYGLALDVGTTSVVLYLVDFATARIIDTASAYNRQIACGDDVISRILYAKRDGGLERLQRLVLETVNGLLEELGERNRIDPARIHEVVAAGNTTMTHLLLGVDPRYLREEPYIPTVSLPPQLTAAELGLGVCPLARVHCLPSVGSYVGGDITAGVVATGLYATEALTLFIDIGTNGEMVLGTKDWLLACACSAGPAFEGGGVGHGMRAAPGAIEDVYVDDETLEPIFRTVDDAPAVGICGSGLIDLLSELFVTGVLDRSGRLSREAPTERVRIIDGIPEYVVAWAHEAGADVDIVLTESDIAGLLRAKAAIYAGCSVLCRSVGVDLADVERIIIGGAFGQYINVDKAIRIGLLPDQPVERFQFLGNTSAQGACAALVCADMRDAVLDVAARMTYLELSADNAFMHEYTSALFLPHTELAGFPTVAETLTSRGARVLSGNDWAEDGDVRPGSDR